MEHSLVDTLESDFIFGVEGRLWLVCDLCSGTAHIDTERKNGKMKALSDLYYNQDGFII